MLEVRHAVAIEINWDFEMRDPRGHVTQWRLGPNEMTTAGLNNLLDVLCGTNGGGTKIDATNAFIGVGDSNSAFSAGQTDLQATTNKLRKGMSATFPSRTGQTQTFRASFGTSEANFTWQEFGLFTAVSSGVMISRRVQNLGTKTGGSTWTLTATLALS